MEFSLYGLLLAAGALMAIIYAVWAEGRNTDRKALTAACLLSVPLGALGARLFYCLSELGFYLGEINNLKAVLYIRDGGLCLYGAFALTLVAAWGIGRLYGEKLIAKIVPGFIFFAACAYLAQYAADAGYGNRMSGSVPVLTMTVGDAAYLNIPLLSSAVCVLLLLLNRKDPARLCFLFGVTRLILESLRRDGHMMWGFVHAEMALALITALIALFVMLPGKRNIAWILVGTGVLAGLIVALEFALDRSSISDLLLYGVYVLVLAVYAWLMLKRRKTARRHVR